MQIQRESDAAVEGIKERRTRQSGSPNFLQSFFLGISTHVQSEGDRLEAWMTTLAHDTQKDEGVVELSKDAGLHRIDLDATSCSVRREAAEEISPSRYSTASGCGSASLKLACPPTVNA
jgi:hypothetical protein